MILPIEKNILEICNDEVTLEYLTKFSVPGGLLYECSSIAVYGTDYKKGQYIILPQSTNSNLIFGKIAKLLCCEKYSAKKIYLRNTITITTLIFDFSPQNLTNLPTYTT